MTCQAILVNYRSGHLICDAAASLASEPACTDIVVVDNSRCPEEAAWLRAHLPERVRLWVAEENLGFGRACNWAFADADSEFVLLLNPDARLFPGALQRLLTTLRERPAVGAVGPRVFWDEMRRFRLPPSTYPSRLGVFLDRLGECWPAIADWRARRFARCSLREWRATRPFGVAALSGGHVLLRRRAVLAAGGLFDPRFFMYWEDSDLMRRLHDTGWSLLLDPRAEALHLYEHSPAKDRMISTGWPIFADKYFSSPGWRAVFWLAARYRSLVPVLPPMTQMLATEDVGIEVPAPWQAGWLLEISPSARFVPAMGGLGTGEQARVPLALIRRFAGCPVYLRLSGVESDGQPRLYLVAPGGKLNC